MPVRYWRPHELALFSKPPDRDIPRHTQRSYVAVLRKRGALKLKPAPTIGQFSDWTLRQERLLGTLPDNYLAKRFGRTFKAVRARRILRRIPAYRQRPWTTADDALLGTTTDLQLARSLGRLKPEV